MSSDRFEIRCTPELRDLVDVVRAIEGDATFSQLFRRLVLNEARALAGPGASLTKGERDRLAKILEKIVRGAS